MILLLRGVLVEVFWQKTRKEATNERHAVDKTGGGNAQQALQKVIGERVAVSVQHMVIGALVITSHFGYDLVNSA